MLGIARGNFIYLPLGRPNRPRRSTDTPVGSVCFAPADGRRGETDSVDARGHRSRGHPPTPGRTARTPSPPPRAVRRRRPLRRRALGRQGLPRCRPELGSVASRTGNGRVEIASEHSLRRPSQLSWPRRLIQLWDGLGVASGQHPRLCADGDHGVDGVSEPDSTHSWIAPLEMDDEMDGK